MSHFIGDLPQLQTNMKNKMGRKMVVPIVRWLFLAAGCTRILAQQQNLRPATVKLLIVCDMAFVHKFDNDTDSIKAFWSNQMWDINMRFKTFPVLNIENRVTDLIMIEKPEDQQFVENINQTGDFKSDLLYGFSEWLYEREKLFQPFDVAILVSAIDSDFNSPSFLYSKTVCQYATNRRTSAGLIMYKFPYYYLTTTIAEILPAILGASWDSKTKACKNSSFALGDHDYGIGRFFYSFCTEDEMSQHLRKEESECVFNTTIESVNVLTNYTHVIPLSLNSQCKALTRDSTAFAANDNQECVVTNCYTLVNATKSSLGHVYPIDNSPCGNSSNCFRGRCLPKGHQFRSLNRNKCIRSSSNFVANDQAVLVNCTTLPTALDTLRIENKGIRGKRLVAPYSLPYRQETDDKCLTVNISNLVVHFTKCSPNPDKHWRFIRAKPNGRVFLMFHRKTSSCLYAANNGSLLVSPQCSLKDQKFLWTFHDEEDFDTGILEEPFSTGIASTTPSNNLNPATVTTVISPPVNGLKVTKQQKSMGFDIKLSYSSDVSLPVSVSFNLTLT